METMSPNGYNLREGGGSRGKLSEESKRRIGDGNRGKICTNETKQKYREAKLGNNYCYGKTHSKETNQKQSNSIKGDIYVGENAYQRNKAKKKQNKAWQE